MYKMVKKLGLYLIVMLLIVVPVFAQDDDKLDNCPADVTPVIATLEALQAEFDSSADLEKYLAGLAEVITELENIQSACTDPLALTAIYVGEHFSIDYPESWVLNDQDDEVLILGSSQEALDAFDSNDPVMPSGEFGIGIFVEAASTLGIPLGSGDPFRQIADVLISSLDNDVDFEFSEPVFFSSNDRRALRIDFVGTGIEAAIIVIDLGDAQFAVFIPAAAIGELANFESTLMAMLETARYDP